MYTDKLFSVDTLKLKGRIIEKGYTVKTLAEYLGIDRNTLAGYLDNPLKLPYRVMRKMIFVLCDNDEDVFRIFFTLNVSSYANSSTPIA